MYLKVKCESNLVWYVLVDMFTVNINFENFQQRTFEYFNVFLQGHQSHFYILLLKYA
jgi:hypothetical protein